jgi:uncharacterized membrane protein
MAHPSTRAASHRLTLAALEHIKQWQVAHKYSQPLEYQLWDAVLTLWLMGWVGWLPAIALEVPLACPLCLLGMGAPRLYVGWRVRAHEAGRLRCDWLHLVR